MKSGLTIALVACFAWVGVRADVGAGSGSSIPEGPGFSIAPYRPAVEYGAIPTLAPVGLSIKGGLMLKDAKPHFWIGQGDGPAASQQGPFGMWLAWLQHADGLTLDNGATTPVREETSGSAVVETKLDAGIASWAREALRLGLMVDYFHGWAMNKRRFTKLRELLERHPDLAEILNDYGHYLGCDTGYPEGVEIMVNRRGAIADALKSRTGDFYMELCREPGPAPTNRRAYEGFRAYVRGKYASLDEATKIWRVPYASWDEIVPPHLDAERWPFRGSIAVYLRRLMLKREYPELYWDWIDYLERDQAKSVKDEIDALHRRAPGVPFTIDLRGHTSRHDAYAAFVPEWISPNEDLVGIHNATRPFFYDGHAYDSASVIQATTFPFFGMGYFRRNTAGALVNSEDIISVAHAPNADTESMRRGCLGQLVNTPWKFKTDPENRGIRNKYQTPGFDDTAWDEIRVPGPWDADSRFSGYGGVAWYRKTFTVPGAYKADHEDGSRIFKLIGKGVAQDGKVWLNGHKLGDVRGWSKPYSFDVGNLLEYGKQNVLVWRVDGCGEAENGLRFDSYILASDMLAKSEPFNERQFRHLVFSQMFEGLSGVWVWHWHDDALRRYQPALYAQAQTVAEVALPALRARRGRVALLYPFSDQPGLPAAHEATHNGYLDFACAAAFLGQKPDIVGEEAFCRDVTPESYPVLLVPLSRRVTSATYAHFKDYVMKGGTAILTEGALALTAERYRPTDIAAFAGRDTASKGPITEVVRGKGRVVTVAGLPTMDELFARIGRYLPPPEIVLKSGNANERALIDRHLAGSSDRKALYLCNWGGQNHPLSVTLPEGVRGWHLTPVVGTFRPKGAARVNVTVPAGDVAIAILDRPGCPRVAVRTVSPLRARKVAELGSLMKGLVPVDRADVLFMRNSPSRGGFRMGAELMPEYLRAAAALGLKCAQSDPQTWTDETLKGKKLVVLAESNSNAFFKSPDKRKPFWEMIDRYVRAGGSVLLVSAQSATANVDGLALRTSERYGAYVARGTAFAKDPSGGVWGDPYQFYGAACADSPICDEVKRVLVGITRPLKAPRPPKRGRKGKSDAEIMKAQPAVRCPDDSYLGVVTTSAFGAGRIVLCTDATMFQPFRIEHGDNANLLVNAMGWLAHKPVDAKIRRAFRSNLFLTESDLKTIETEEK